MKKVLSILLALCMVFILASCGGTEAAPTESTAAGTSTESAGAEAESGDKPVIGFILGDMVNEFYLQMMEAGNQAAEDYGVEVIWQSCDGSVEKEVNLIENFVLQGVDVIAMDPMDAEGVAAACDAAIAAGIPVVSAANKVPSEGIYMTLYDDYSNLKRTTTAMCYAIGEEGHIGLLSGDTGSWVVGQREDGFSDAIAEFPNVTGDIQLAKYDSALAASITENWINTTEIDAIIGISDLYVLASITAAENLGKGEEIVWGGNDGNVENHTVMETGQQLVDTLVGGYRVGYWNVATAARLAMGEELPNELYMKSHMVMTDETAEMLKEKGFEEEYITPEEAADLAVNAQEEYGPQIATEDF